MTSVFFSSERLLHYIKRSALLRSSMTTSNNNYPTPLDIEVYKLVLEYILDLLALDASPFSNLILPMTTQHSSITIVEYSSGANGKIESERYSSSQELISRKISLCVFLQEYSLVLFRNNIPKLYEYFGEIQNIINSGKLDDMTYAQLLVTMTTLYITHNLQDLNPTMMLNHISSLLQYITKTVNNSQFRLQRQMAAESLQEILYFHNIRVSDFIPTLLKCCQAENSHALQSFSTLLANLIYLESNKTKREVINSLTFLIENIQIFTIWGRAAIVGIIIQIIRDTDYPDHLWKRVFGKFKNSINPYLIHLFCNNVTGGLTKQAVSKNSKNDRLFQLNVDDYSQPLYVREQLIYFQKLQQQQQMQDQSLIQLKYFDELPIKTMKCKIISQTMATSLNRNSIESILHLLDCVADYKYYMKALPKYYSKSFKQPQIHEENQTAVTKMERQLHIRFEIIFTVLYYAYKSSPKQCQPILDFLIDILERESGLNLLISPVMDYTISLIQSLDHKEDNDLVEGLFNHIIHLSNEKLGYYFSLFEALITNLKNDRVTKMLSCLYKFARSKPVANFGDWNFGDSILSIIRMVIYRACHESSPSSLLSSSLQSSNMDMNMDPSEVHFDPQQWTLIQNILSLLIQDYNNLEIKQRSHFYWTLLNLGVATNKRKLLSILGYAEDGLVSNAFISNVQVTTTTTAMNRTTTTATATTATTTTTMTTGTSSLESLLSEIPTVVTLPFLQLEFVKNVGHEWSLLSSSLLRVRALAGHHHHHGASTTSTTSITNITSNNNHTMNSGVGGNPSGHAPSPFSSHEQSSHEFHVDHLGIHERASSLLLVQYYMDKYVKSFRYQIQLQYKISALVNDRILQLQENNHSSMKNVKSLFEKLVGIELIFGGDSLDRFIGLENGVNIPYLKIGSIRDQSVVVEMNEDEQQLSTLPSEHLFTLKFFPVKPLPGVIHVSATFTAIKRENASHVVGMTSMRHDEFSQMIEPMTAFCQTQLPDIHIQFKDLFLPIFDRDLPEGLTKEALFEAMWNYKNGKMASSVKILKNTLVSEVMESFKLFAVNPKDYILIFLPPKYHLLIRVSQKDETTTLLSIKTDYWQCLSFVDEIFQQRV
ncbi:hypothetical protein C9374_004002 [Naegleria lovaniensis]|uniref:AP5B1 C-terminal domain-containing protein n=1 Tax=Naegleria lovaniensis TaxID=51637 RepID=A0AA88KQH4_NAELO|nr:uncharacterized protein C9374_004002 [Naegleria lovaniensis]KAG2394238.1 hypothetical protein C9374_004002 [Naegleria lovaniensis]